MLIIKEYTLVWFGCDFIFSHFNNRQKWIENLSISNNCIESSVLIGWMRIISFWYEIVLFISTHHIFDEKVFWILMKHDTARTNILIINSLFPYELLIAQYWLPFIGRRHNEMHSILDIDVHYSNRLMLIAVYFIACDFQCQGNEIERVWER